MVSLISQWGHKNGAYEYVIDTLNDLENVPTDVAVGTVVFCIENSKTYMLNGSGVYVEVNFKKGGKGGEGSAPKGNAEGILNLVHILELGEEHEDGGIYWDNTVIVEEQES